MHKTTNASMWNQIKQKHSELEKPYHFKMGEYGKMQHYYPNLPGFSPWLSDLKFDHPWMNEQVPDASKIGRVFYGFTGCGFEFPGLFPAIARCETKCEYLDDWHMHRNSPGGAKVPDDPIVKWEAKNGVITESDIFHACIKADEDAPYGQFVELIATTESGLTCKGFAWVEGDECDECIPDVSMAWDSGTSAETVARN
ncbi:MAG: hypothetical protein U9O65_05575, partial [Thermotogota bacterium]|nr:hypothetical protein [Thermotogota bacterium]